MSDDKKLSLAEEALRIDTRQVASGSVRVRTVVEKFEEVAKATLQHEHVSVTRVPIGKVIDCVPMMRTEGDTTVIPVVEEIVEVQKKLLLKEEIHIRRETIREDVAVPVELRRERAIVERLNSEGQINPLKESK